MSNSDEIRLAEFAALRQETGQRAALQQALVALNITVAGVITGFVVSDRADQALFVVVSLTAGVLGLLWIEPVRGWTKRAFCADRAPVFPSGRR